MRMLVVLLLSGLVASSAMADKRWSWGDTGRWAKSEHAQKWRGSASKLEADDEDDRNEQRAAGWGDYRSTIAASQQKPKRSRNSRYSDRLNQLNWSNLNSGVCDELRGGTRGLRMLCMAFCELQSCQPDYSLDNPFQNCARSSKWILARYDARRGAGDPEMPCIKQPETSPECPCWTRNELASVPNAAATDSTYCMKDLTTTAYSNYDFWLISGTAGAMTRSTSLASIENSVSEGGPVCSLSDSCSDGSCAGVSRYMSITPAQFAACEVDVAMSAQDRGLTCQ